MGSNYETQLVVTDTILTYDIAKKAAFVYDVLGEEPQKQFALALAERTGNAVRENLLDKETAVISNQTQTGQAMGLYYGIFEDSEREKALKVLIDLIEKNNGYFNTGVLGAQRTKKSSQ